VAHHAPEDWDVPPSKHGAVLAPESNCPDIQEGFALHYSLQAVVAPCRLPSEAVASEVVQILAQVTPSRASAAP